MYLVHTLTNGSYMSSIIDYIPESQSKVRDVIKKQLDAEDANLTLGELVAKYPPPVRCLGTCSTRCGVMHAF